MPHGHGMVTWHGHDRAKRSPGREEIEKKEKRMTNAHDADFRSVSRRQTEPLKAPKAVLEVNHRVAHLSQVWPRRVERLDKQPGRHAVAIHFSLEMPAQANRNLLPNNPRVNTSNGQFVAIFLSCFVTPKTDIIRHVQKQGVFHIRHVRQRGIANPIKHF